MLKKLGIKKEVVYVVLFVFMLAFIILFRGKLNKYKPRNEEEIKPILINNINKISDNYTLNIFLYKNEEEYKLEYMTDSKIKMYSSDAFKVTGYLIYNDKYYQLDNDELKKVKSIDINGIFDERYYNFELIKNIIDKCSMKKSSLIRFTCDVKLNDYLEEYNKLFDTEYTTDEESFVEYEFLYDDTRIRSIKIDYSNVINYLDNTSDKIVYLIDIDNINKNDFSEYIEYIEKKN